MLVQVLSYLSLEAQCYRNLRDQQSLFMYDDPFPSLMRFFNLHIVLSTPLEMQVPGR